MAEEDMVAEDMEVATRAGMVATRVTIEDIMEVMSARRATLRIRFLVPPWTRLRWIARHLARSSRRRFQRKNLRTGLSPGLISVMVENLDNASLDVCF
jgi:hypothetical protein